MTTLEEYDKKLIKLREEYRENPSKINMLKGKLMLLARQAAEKRLSVFEQAKIIFDAREGEGE